MLSLFDDIFTIEGLYVRLEPLTLEHVAEVAPVALDPAVWRYSLKAIKQMNTDGVEHYIRNLLQERSVRFGLPFVARDKSESRPLGIAKFENITPRHERMDIGYIWVGAPHDSNFWLPRIIYDLSNYAFCEQNVRRLGNLVDSEHTILRSATERVGFQFEGILRHYLMYPDGHYGNFVSYSILADEWSSITSESLDL